jgi:hypothetical protein
MKLHWADCARSCVVALILLGLAAFAVFKIPHGFEGGVGWYLVLLPGAFFAAAISDFLRMTIPREGPVTFYGLLACFNFVWYFLITFSIIKTYRFVSPKRKVTPEQFAEKLEKHLLGTEGKWDWDDTTSMAIADERLERIRRGLSKFDRLARSKDRDELGAIIAALRRGEFSEIT